MSNDSKFLSRVLRHEPELIEIQLDRQGWVLVDDLLRKMKKIGRRLTPEQLRKIVETNDKGRFTFSPDRRRIRAAQGHSVDVDLGLSPQVPPEVLYHGTAAQSLVSIFGTGLNSGRRQQVHLSPDPETATRVGRRHGKPTVLRVDAGGMHTAGHFFYQSDNGVWLTDYVPVPFLGFASVQQDQTC